LQESNEVAIIVHRVKEDVMSKVLQDLIQNEILMSAFLSWFLAQVIKTILYFIVNKEWNFERLVGSGGMPSCHSASVCALTTAVLINEGFHSPLFVICGVFSFIVMYDATGVRRETGIQAQVLNDIVELLSYETDKVIMEKKLKEFIGHTPIQVCAGAILGICFSLFYCLVLVK
jgi:acid phosphatase family membrane protein YuiD